MTTIATYDFGREFVAEAQAKVTKINNRAAKAGITGYTVEVAPYTKITEDGHFDMVNFSVLGDAPKIAGWEFLATMDTDSLGVTTTRVVPGAVESDLSGFRTRVGECDHCKINRARNCTYIVRNVATGEMLQVGSTCLTAFLGMGVSLAWIGEVFEGNDGSMGFGWGERSYNLDHFMAVVCAVVEREGWLSRSAARG